MTRLRADLILLTCAAVWGYAFLCQKRAMEHIGPYLFIALRSWLACLVLVPLAWREYHAARGHPAAVRSVLRMSVYAGLAFFGAAALQQTGLVTATVTNSGFLTALYVVITPLFGWLLLRQKPSGWVWIAAVLSFAGTWLLGGGSWGALSRGDILVAISASLWALHVVLVGMAARHHLSAFFTAAQFVVVGLAAGGMAFTEPFSLQAVRLASMDVIYVGVLSSAVTFTLLSVALRATRPAEAAILLSTESLFAALAAYIWMHERLPAIAWLGAGMIFTATLLVQLPGRKRAL